MLKMINSLMIFIIFLLAVCCKKDLPVAPSVEQPDTTSHTINWLIEDIGGYGSILRDVTIINDTLAYAVGEINKNDTLFNAARWDGQKWILLQIPFIGPCSAVLYPPLKSIWSFSPTNIIVTNGGSIVHYNGTDASMDCRMSTLLIGAITKIWAVNSDNIYAIGDYGSIVFYQNNNWMKFESNTHVSLRDIWGSPDGSIVWVAGFEDSYGTVLLRNTGNGFQKVLEITDPGMPHPPDKITHVFKSLWTDKTDTVYLGAIGRVYAAPKHILGAFAPAKENTWWDYENQTEYPPETNIIRGTAGNDIFIAGYNQFIRHWNGASWKIYNEIEGDGEWYGMAVKDNFIIAVGINFNAPGSARIARGYRIK
jgi:hypothetical protein